MAAPKKKKVVKKKIKTGRPTLYKKDYAEQVYQLCLMGATDATLADQFNVHIDTIHEWKKKHIEFSDSIKKGKYFADSQIASSLFERAKGLTITKQVAIKLTTKSPILNAEGEPTRSMEQTERVVIVDLTEHVPPDTTAGIFWLKNRQPKEWRDKQAVELTGKDGESIKIETVTGIVVE